MNNEHKVIQPHTKVCSLPVHIFDALGLRKNRLYHLCVGHLTQEVLITPTKSESGDMYLPKQMAEHLCVYPYACLNIWRVTNHINLGPVVGVFVHPKHIAEIAKGKPPGSVQKHMQANEESQCFLYYFSIRDINWSTSKVRGYTYHPHRKKWRKTWFSLPTIIYDRGLGFKEREQPLVEQIRQQFAENSNVQLINSGSLWKWEVYTSLSRHPQIKEYLPYTIIYTSFADVIHMLDEYGFIFVKSSAGYGAREVISIKKEGSKYSLTFYERGLKMVKVGDLVKLEKVVQRFLKPKTYIVQQGIPTMKMKNLHMDLRLLIQKNRHGEWQVTYHRARIAKDIFSIINSSLALRIVNYKNLKQKLKDTMNAYFLPEESQVEAIAVRIAKYIEKECGMFGEIGMDMVIDEQGQLWFIEANSKPTKLSLPKLEQATTSTLAQFVSVLEYAKYLQKVSSDKYKVVIHVDQ